MDIRKIKKLIEMLQESDLNEIEVTQGEESVKISRGGSFARVDSIVSQAPISAPQTSLQNEEMVEEKKIEGNVVTSPIVGTFYRKPSPDKPVFVEVGTNIKEGDVLFMTLGVLSINNMTSCRTFRTTTTGSSG